MFTRVKEENDHAAATSTTINILIRPVFNKPINPSNPDLERYGPYINQCTAHQQTYFFSFIHLSDSISFTVCLTELIFRNESESRLLAVRSVFVTNTHLLLYLGEIC
jgi:hypothetical protein